ncbi:MAG TPA: sulfotransferase [Thermohalobaculum sp.]|nr:sulfotransferase [Thermohalobaculum sp.]
MHYLFVGGPGRSGTSFVADRLGLHPGVRALKDIELKIFCEKNGLLDLYHALVETYSPNRAAIALDQFRHMSEALIEGRYGQAPLTSAAPVQGWRGAFDGFTAALIEDGHPVPQTAESYLAAARGLLARIAALAGRAPGHGRPERDAPDGNAPNHDAPADDAPRDLLFVEKTPHNLLAIGFLARLAPGARFLHVMRDPRAIAWSLLAMSWGPGELTTAARWVDSYCRAWTAAEAEAASLGLPLLRLHIEDAVAAPGAAAAWLTARLGLAPRPDLFGGANPQVLSRGVAKAGDEERALLDRRLGGWAAHFGYEAGQIGQRAAPAFARPEPTQPDPTQPDPTQPEAPGRVAPAGA